MLISLITYRDLAQLDPDDLLLARALERRGCKVQGLVWNEEDVDWSKAGICIVRSTWDYHRHYKQFLSWIEHVSKVTSLFNSAELIKWNSKKTYLKELSEGGLPIIPTRFVTHKERPTLAEIVREHNWERAIIKPTVGIATSGVKRIECTEDGIREGELHIESLLHGGEVMVQEFFDSVEGYGERALSFIDGVYSHCIRKAPFQRLAAAGLAGEMSVDANEKEIDLGRRTLQFLDVIPLYARVDLACDVEGNPRIMEFELVEPSLFLQTKPDSAEVFADAVMKRVACLQK